MAWRAFRSAPRSSWNSFSRWSKVREHETQGCDGARLDVDQDGNGWLLQEVKKRSRTVNDASFHFLEQPTVAVLVHIETGAITTLSFMFTNFTPPRK